jgi:phosphotransferase system enzyme I (PtsP)
MQPGRVSLLEEICGLITESKDPRRTLDMIVELVAERFDIDVCSVYIFDEEGDHLVLASTVGLNRSAIGSVQMRVGEGLTGMVLEKMGPLLVRDPADHPRYKYFAESGEEVYRTFLGLPLIYHRKNMGALVVQTVDVNAISEGHIPAFSAITSQVAATVAYSGLLADLQRSHRGSPGGQTPVATEKLPAHVDRKPLFRGTPVSSGFGQGVAHYLGSTIGFDQVKIEIADDPAAERRRVSEAFQAAWEDAQALRRRAADVPAQDAAIIEANLMLLEDEGFKGQILDSVDLGFTAPSALKQVVLEYLDYFNRMDDPYLKERGADIVDAGKRLLSNLLGLRKSPATSFEKDTIVIASDLSVTDLLHLRQRRLKGIVLSKGGKTSHAVILAKSFEIPMVIGVKDILDSVRERDRLIIDGSSGLVFREPPSDIRREYTRLRAEKRKSLRQLARLRGLKAETGDGYVCRLGANIGLLSDLELAHRYGADHIGLYRTEFPFLASGDFPTEEEQVELYGRVMEGARGKAVTFRTLDVGGDKFLSYLDYPREPNPYLGWRSVRVSLELDDIFRAQIRAVLRASARGQASLMFPMITSVEEVREIVRIVAEEKSRLQAAALPFDPRIPLGIMVEVPAAVRVLRHLLRYVDFVSIGTNDLTQYTLAVDRNNERLSALYTPLHPAVIATVHEVVSVCRELGKKVSICGEAGSTPSCTILHLGMGLERLSMNPASIPLIKELIRSVKLQEAKSALATVMQMEDATEVTAYLEKICRDKVGAYLL